MKPVHKNHLGINLLSNTVHVDNWNGKPFCDNFLTYCGIYPEDYELLHADHITLTNPNIRICLKCSKIALRKKRCLVTAVVLLKLKRN